MNEQSDTLVRSGWSTTRPLGHRVAWARLSLPAAAVLAFAACAPTVAPSAPAGAAGTSDVQPAPPAEASTPAPDTAPDTTPSTASSPTPSPAPAASVLRVGILGASENLDPRVSQAVPDTQVMFAIMEPLITETPEYELRPRLATSWTVTEDGRSIRLELREGVRFHDGTAFTLEDVKFTLESALDSGNEGLVSHLGDVIEGVEAPDPATVIVRFGMPAAYALYDLALIPMMPAEAADDFGDHPIGTGPYRFDLLDARPTGTWIVTRVFDDYWGEEASFDGVEFRLFGGGAVNEAAATLANGRLDLAQATMDGDKVRELPNHRGLEVRGVPGSTATYVAMNTTAALLDIPASKTRRTARANGSPRSSRRRSGSTGLSYEPSSIRSRTSLAVGRVVTSSSCSAVGCPATTRFVGLLCPSGVELPGSGVLQ